MIAYLSIYKYSLGVTYAVEVNIGLCFQKRTETQRDGEICTYSTFGSERPRLNHWSASVQFSSVQSFSRVRLFKTPWIAPRQASLSITNSRSSLRLTSIESVMPSSHLITGRTLLQIICVWLYCSCVVLEQQVAERRYPTSKVSSGDCEEISYVQENKQWLNFAGTTRDDGNEDRGLLINPSFLTNTHLFWKRTSWLTKHRPYLTPPNLNPTGLRDFITDFILSRVDMATTENCLIFISL